MLTNRTERGGSALRNACNLERLPPKATIMQNCAGHEFAGLVDPAKVRPPSSAATRLAAEALVHRSGRTMADVPFVRVRGTPKPGFGGCSRKRARAKSATEDPGGLWYYGNHGMPVLAKRPLGERSAATPDRYGPWDHLRGAPHRGGGSPGMGSLAEGCRVLVVWCNAPCGRPDTSPNQVPYRPPQTPVCQTAEPPSNGVQRRTAGRQNLRGEAGMAPEPLIHPATFAYSGVAHDPVQRNIHRCQPLDQLPKSDPILLAVWGHADPKEPGLHPVTRRKQRQGSAAQRVVCHRCTTGRFYRQAGARRIRRLKLALLRGAGPQGPAWRIQTQPHNVPRLLLKMEGTPDLEGADPVELDRLHPPGAMHHLEGDTRRPGPRVHAPVREVQGAGPHGAFQNPPRLLIAVCRSPSGRRGLLPDAGPPFGGKTHPSKTGAGGRESRSGRQPTTMGALRCQQEAPGPANPSCSPAAAAAPSFPGCPPAPPQSPHQSLAWHHAAVQSGSRTGSPVRITPATIFLHI
jgi:hypothetical protein